MSDRLAPAATPTPRLELAPYDIGAALALERELGVSHVLAQVLVRRGLSDPVTARAFLDPREHHSPLEFEGIERVLATIRRHIEAGSRIVVHGDYDVDGICATAIMVRALRSLQADVGWFLPSRRRDGYGLAQATVQRLSRRGTGLLITVDCAITAVEQVQDAIGCGIDVVVTDHHAPRADGALPACGIVHPALCGYPCPELCGTGVAHKLAEALGAPSAAEDVELVALATVADLVPLRGENRRLVRAGLRQLAGTAKPGLRALMAVSRTDPSSLDSGAIGFRLAPRINAAGRLADPDAALELLLTGDEPRAREIAAELDALNAHRRWVEERIGWAAEAQVAALGERPLYVLAGEDWHPGVIGIVASRVVERHDRPAILIALDGDQPAQGSGRSIPGFDLLAALHHAGEQMVRWGGHRAAAGLTIEPGRIGALREQLEHYAEGVLSDELLTPVEHVDAVAGGAELGLALAEELGALEPHGLGNPKSRLLVPGARFDDVRTMGEGKHARFSVRSGGVRARAIAFGCGGRPAENLELPLDATFRLELNTYNGAVEPQLRLGHARGCAPAAIELVGKPEDFLTLSLAELDARLDEAPAAAGGSGGREVLDRREQSALSVLADACSAGDTLAVCADVPRRFAGLRERAGGFALISADALRRAPQTAHSFEQLVMLDPPTSEAMAQLSRSGSGFTHLAWGEPELRFAEQMHELEYRLRDSLAGLYRELRLRGRAAGEELEHLLRGGGPHGRPARLAGRLIRVLVELELVSLDRALPALAIVDGVGPTALGRSPAFRTYQQRHEDGIRFLSSTRRRAIS